MHLVCVETATNYEVLDEIVCVKLKVISAIKIVMVFLIEKLIEINLMDMVAHYDFHQVNFVVKEGREIQD